MPNDGESRRATHSRSLPFACEIACRTGVLEAWSFAVAALLFAGGCGTARPRITTVDIQPVPRSAQTPPPDLFARGYELLKGFDPPGSDGAWRVGDQVVCGLQFARGGHEQLLFGRITVRTGPLNPGDKVHVGPPPVVAAPDRNVRYVPHADPATSVDRQSDFAAANWVLSLAVSSPGHESRRVEYTSRMVLLSVEMFDRNLKRISTSHTLAPEECLKRGAHLLSLELLQLRERLGPRVAHVLQERPAEFNIPAEHLADIICTLFALRDTLWSTPSVYPMLDALVQKPSLWSILVNGGVKVAPQIRFADVMVDDRKLPTLTQGRTAVVVPFDVNMNGQLSAQCRLSICPAQPPLHAVAGIVAVDARHPTLQDRWLHFRVLAARRGPTPGRLN